MLACRRTQFAISGRWRLLAPSFSRANRHFPISRRLQSGISAIFDLLFQFSPHLPSSPLPPSHDNTFRLYPSRRRTSQLVHRPIHSLRIPSCCALSCLCAAERGKSSKLSSSFWGFSLRTPTSPVSAPRSDVSFCHKFVPGQQDRGTCQANDCCTPLVYQPVSLCRLHARAISLIG